MPETFIFIDSDGAEFSMSGPDVKVLAGVTGRFMPPVSFVEEEIPLQPGSRRRQTKTLPRNIDLPVQFRATDAISLRAAIREWLRRLDPQRGEGRLRVRAPGGDQREIACSYSEGMEGVENSSTAGATWLKAVLTFRAFDPYWRDVATNISVYTIGAPVSFFPFFPLRLSSSSVFANITVTNDGDVEAWPEWTIVGPGSGIVLKNLTSGEAIELDTALSPGETLTIDTRPSIKTVTGPGGANLFGDMSPSSSLWLLQRGSNSVQIEVSDATIDTRVQLSYRRRYLGV